MIRIRARLRRAITTSSKKDLPRAQLNPHKMETVMADTVSASDALVRELRLTKGETDP